MMGMKVPGRGKCHGCGNVFNNLIRSTAAPLGLFCTGLCFQNARAKFNAGPNAVTKEEAKKIVGGRNG